MLRPYQIEAVSFLLSHRRSILGLAPGTGKTPTTLVALRDAGPWRTLIVAPKSVVPHWIDLAAVWFPELRVIDGTGPAGHRKLAVNQVAGQPTGPVALIINYESMRQDVDHLATVIWGAAVFDEAHRLKTRSALVTRAARHLTRHPRMWCWLVSGTPFPNRPTEVWSLLNLLEPTRFSSYWRWVRTHCTTEVPDWARFGRRHRYTEVVTGLKEGAVERIRAELADVLHFRSLDELLPHLPGATVTVVPVVLDASEARVYRDLLRRSWAAIDSEDGSGKILLQAPNKISKMTRLRQVVSDLEVLGAQRDRPGSKIAAAAELIADLEPEQVVVLTWTRAAAERVAAEVGGGYIHGGVGRPAREEILANFRAGRTRVLAGTTDTLGEGVDGMQVARHLIRLDKSWVPARNEQSVARLRRSGQSRSVFVWDLSARLPDGGRTIDQVVESALAEKVEILDALLGDPDLRL